MTNHQGDHEENHEHERGRSNLKNRSPDKHRYDNRDDSRTYGPPQKYDGRDRKQENIRSDKPPHKYGDPGHDKGYDGRKRSTHVDHRYHRENSAIESNGDMDEDSYNKPKVNYAKTAVQSYDRRGEKDRRYRTSQGGTSPVYGYNERRERYESSPHHRASMPYEEGFEVGLDDKPWYMLAGDVVNNSCPVLNCESQYSDSDSETCVPAAKDQAKTP